MFQQLGHTEFVLSLFDKFEIVGIGNGHNFESVMPGIGTATDVQDLAIRTAAQRFDHLKTADAKFAHVDCRFSRSQYKPIFTAL